MAGRSENTPFLADNDHSDEYGEHHYTKNAPANSHFKKPIRIATGVISLLCFAVFGLLIATIVLLKIGPFQYVYRSIDTTRDLAICLIVNFVLSLPTFFLDIPILITSATNLAMSVVILVFSAHIFNSGWPDSGFCYRWDTTPGGSWKPLPETHECQHDREIIRILMGVSGGVGILIGILILSILFLRIVAIARTKFWQGKNVGNISGLGGWNPTGFTVQFTLSIIPQERSQAARATEATRPVASGSEEGRLIDT